MNLSVHYDIDAFDPNAHIFKIIMRIDAPEIQGQRLQLPAWIPGSYMIREFAKNIVRMRASCNQDPVDINKLDKHTWQVDPCDGPLILEYEVYAYDLSVRTAHLDQTHAFFNGSSVFLQALGLEQLPHVVNIQKPRISQAKNWRVATALLEKEASRYGFGSYQAENYDELIDCPVEMGDFTLGHFDAFGTIHDIAITGKIPNLDLEQLEHDLKTICETEIAFFEPNQPNSPVSRYVFLIMTVSHGYGGLEHRSSTALICPRSSLPTTAKPASIHAEISDYQKFLGLCSHEYFHTWNVKRIKPAVFAPYDLTKETYTPLLWIFEGFTSYYDDLTLLRAHLINIETYLKLVENTINSVMRGNGHLKQSVAQASFDAWIKYYRQDENSPNALVSYYTKGALIALTLDLTIRLRSHHTKSLDDIMQVLWQRFGVNFYQKNSQGITPKQAYDLINEISKLDLTEFFKRYVQGTEPLPLQSLLNDFGIILSDNSVAKPGLNISVKRVENDCIVTHVYENGAAHKGGIAAGDTLLAIDGIRVSADNASSQLEKQLAIYHPGQQIMVHVFRRDELHEIPITIQDERIASYTLKISDKETLLQKEIRNKWLHCISHKI